MDKFVIRGGKPLQGSIRISGSKNATLPILAATLLTREPCVIRNVPNLSDVHFMAEILRWLNVKVKHHRSEGVLEVRAHRPSSVAPYELARRMRASVCLLGPLLARLRNCMVSLPGGCVIGHRPIDHHVKALRQLGAQVNVRDGYVLAHCAELVGTDLFMGGRFGSTVLGTANVMMAAVLAKGKTFIESAACEPEIEDLAQLLIKMGAKIRGVGEHVIEIEGVRELHGAEHTVIPDRIEAGTFMIAAAVTGGEVEIKGARSEHLSAVQEKLRELGVMVEGADAQIRVRKTKRLRSVDVITFPHPGFPTDLQAQISVLLTITPGISIVTDKVFPNRFMHVSELARLGANITLERNSAIIKGVKRLSGAPVMASDLRASAALVLAGLTADGETEVNRIYHVDRGYERIDQKLSALGAEIKRVSA